MPLSNEEKIAICRDKIASYKEMLEMMPNDTILGRMCLISYIKIEEKKIKKITEKC